MSQTFYITTPIYYVNARPHLGHAYTTIVADVVCRYHALCGKNTFFLTGTDEHGDKIVEAAAKAGRSPREYVDEISADFQALWPKLSVENDAFIRTTDPNHIALVQNTLQRIYDSGDIYFAEYEGLYCFGCERFYTERELVDGQCPDHLKPPTSIKESNYFFRMSKYQQWLIDHIRANPEFIRPERYRNEVLSFLQEPLEDLCISRPKKRLQWGITLPFDDQYVTYVWFDALLNYLTALGYPNGDAFSKYWPSANHLVAKDILKPHGIYWPTMLKAAGIPVYQHLNVHGYWNVDTAKMSKSIGNVVVPLTMVDKYGIDAFRYFLIREMSFGLDSNFSEDAIIQRINSDLANDLGNLLSRVLTMVHKYCDGLVPYSSSSIEAELNLSLIKDAEEMVSLYHQEMRTFALHKGMICVWEFISRMNKYVDVMAPWVLAKKKEAREQLNTVLYNLLEGLRLVACLIYPVMPTTAFNMLEHLGVNPDELKSNSHALLGWGSLQPGTKLGKSITLFPRIEKQNEIAPEIAPKVTPEIKPEITYDDFQKVDLRIGTVLEAERIAKSKKLLKLKVDIGEIRTIIAGIAEYRQPEELVGRQVIIVANLTPAKLMGVLSQGMVLAAIEKGSGGLATVDQKVRNGMPLK